MANRRITKTIAREELARRRNGIYDFLEGMGNLQYSAQAIIDFAYALSPAGCFDYESEWVMRDDNWIALKFSNQRTKNIIVSIGIEPDCKRSDLLVREGRWPGWARFKVINPNQLLSALHYMEFAAIHTSNRFRSNYGKIAKIKGKYTVPESLKAYEDSRIEKIMISGIPGYRGV